jgi:hypothetical protein
MTVQWPIPTVLIACYFNLMVSTVSLFTTFLAILTYFQSFTIRQTYQNLFLLTLLVNAMIFSVNSFIFYILILHAGNSNILSVGWICDLNGFLNFFCSGMEIYALMCIALERYFVIKRQEPLTFHQVMAMIVFGVCWVGLITR